MIDGTILGRMAGRSLHKEVVERGTKSNHIKKQGGGTKREQGAISPGPGSFSGPKTSEKGGERRLCCWDICPKKEPHEGGKERKE